MDNRISDILIKARDTLADPSGDRWDDNRLLRLVDEAQKDIVKTAKLLRTKSNIPVASLNSKIPLPNDLLLLTRVTFSNKKLSFVSREDLDDYKDTWEEDIGEPRNIIADKLNRKVIEVYPKIPDDSLSYNYTFEYYTLDNTICLLDSTYGVVTSIEGFNIDDFGVVTDIDAEDLPTVSDDFGELTSLSESAYVFTIHYLKTPETISSIDDKLEIDDIFDKAIKYYIVGMALRDDMDTQNRVVGNEELSFFYKELEYATKDSYMDFASTGKRFESKYNGGI